VEEKARGKLKPGYRRKGTKANPENRIIDSRGHPGVSPALLGTEGAQLFYRGENRTSGLTVGSRKKLKEGEW